MSHAEHALTSAPREPSPARTSQSSTPASASTAAPASTSAPRAASPTEVGIAPAPNGAENHFLLLRFLRISNHGYIFGPSNTGLPHNPRASVCRRHNGIGTKRNRREKHRSDIGEVEDGAADGNRTHDLRLTKASLYPLATAAVVIQRNYTSFIKVWFQTSDPTP